MAEEATVTDLKH